MSPLLKEDSKKTPAKLEIPRRLIEFWWDDWRLWRLCGRKFSEFVIARKLPKAMIKVFSFLDYFYLTMELERDKQKAEKSKGKRSPWLT